MLCGAVRWVWRGVAWCCVVIYRYLYLCVSVRLGVDSPTLHDAADRLEGAQPPRCALEPTIYALHHSMRRHEIRKSSAKPPGSFTRHVNLCHNRVALGVAHQSFSVPEGRTDEMGQALTTPVPDSKLIDAKFINLSKQALESLWTSYNLIGEGWVRNARLLCCCD
jgi:hypothetical protein